MTRAAKTTKATKGHRAEAEAGTGPGAGGVGDGGLRAAALKEASTRLDQARSQARRLEGSSPRDTGRILTALGRAFHSIRGLALFLELDDLARAATAARDLAEAQAIAGGTAQIGPLLAAADDCERLVESLKATWDPDAGRRGIHGQPRRPAPGAPGGDRRVRD